MAREELRRRMNDEVGAVLDRPAEIRGRQRVVDDQRDACPMRDFGDALDVDDNAAGVGEVLDEDRLALRGQRLAEILRLGRVDEMAGPAELLERQAELRERAAVEIARRDELVAGPHQREEGQELRRVPRRGGDRGAAALEGREPFFQHGDGRVGQPRIDVAEIVQIEERGGVVDVVEHIGRRLIDRRRARAGRRIGRGAGMDRAGLETVIEVQRRRRALPDPARQRRVRRAVADDAAVDAAPRQFAAEPPELDLRAAVHDDFDPASLRGRRRLVVADAQLHPHDLGADRDRVGDDAGRFLGGAEHVHHVDLVRDVARATRRPSRRAGVLPAMPGLTGITR